MKYLKEEQVLACHFCNTEAITHKIINGQRINLCWICYCAFTGTEYKKGIVYPKKD